jgi:hypothetical protein
LTINDVVGHPGRAYGFLEVGLATPVAAFDLYVAGNTSNELLRGAWYVAAGWSAALAIHGLYTIVRPDDQQSVALHRGGSLAPTVVSDGRTCGVGLGFAGRF